MIAWRSDPGGERGVVHDKLIRTVLMIAIAMALLAHGFAARAAPGQLDPSFSEDGWTRTIHVMHDGQHSMLPEVAEDIAFDSRGNIVATGEIVDGAGGWWFGMFRYTPAGELDESFGSGGAAMTPAAGAIIFPHGIAVQANDKPVVVGSAECDLYTCFGIGRYLTNGMRDPDFGTDGFVRTKIGWSTSVATQVALDLQGRIVAVGRTSRGGDANDDDTIAVARYLPDGRLDKTFSGDGKAWFNVRFGDEVATGVHVRPDGRIYITGFVDLHSRRLSDFLILRLRGSGALDSSFSKDGIRLFDVGANDFSYGSALAPDGDLLLAGRRAPREWWNKPGKAAVVRFSSSGSFDRAFGKKLFHPGAFGGYASDVAVHPDGDVVVPGALWEHEDDGGSEWFVVRWNANGTRDDSWGSSGMVRVDFGTGEDEPYDVEVDEAGRVVVGGSVYSSQALARFLEE